MKSMESAETALLI